MITPDMLPAVGEQVSLYTAAHGPDRGGLSFTGVIVEKITAENPRKHGETILTAVKVRKPGKLSGYFITTVMADFIVAVATLAPDQHPQLTEEESR